MDYKIKPGTMSHHLNTFYDKIINDEILMRLLCYKPANQREGRPHPLDISLPNIVGGDNNIYWDFVDSRVLTTVKSSDIEDKEELCRLYIYPGRRRPDNKSYVLAKQEIIIDVLVHESYSSDLRQERICDRLNELLALEHITGFGKVEYAGGAPRNAPIEYSKYENIFLIGDGKK